MAVVGGGIALEGKGVPRRRLCTVSLQRALSSVVEGYLLGPWFGSNPEKKQEKKIVLLCILQECLLTIDEATACHTDERVEFLRSKVFGEGRRFLTALHTE